MQTFEQLTDHLTEPEERSAVGPTLTLLIEDVSSLTSANTHPVLPKLVEYLERLREDCEKPHGLAQQRNRVEELASTLLCQTLSKRCLSLLEILVNEAS